MHTVLPGINKTNTWHKLIVNDRYTLYVTLENNVNKFLRVTGQDIEYFVAKNYEFHADAGVIADALGHLTAARSLHISNVCDVPLDAMSLFQLESLSLQGCGLVNSINLPYVRRLDVVRNPISNIRFAEKLLEIKLSRDYVDPNDIPPMVPSLVMICEAVAQSLFEGLKSLSITDFSKKIGTISIHRYVRALCSTCGERNLCEKLSIYGFMTYLCCYRCMMFGARPMYDVVFDDDIATLTAATRTYHTFIQGSSSGVQRAPDSAMLWLDIIPELRRHNKMRCGGHKINKYNRMFRFNRQGSRIALKGEKYICLDRFEHTLSG